MPMIPERERQQIREIFERDLVGDVRLELFTRRPSLLFVPGRQDHEVGPETEALLREISDLSEKLQFEIHDVQSDSAAAAEARIGQVPTVVLHGTNAGTVRFLGAPAGYEFSALIADIVDLSTGEVSLTEETKGALQAITEPVHIQVFSTPT
ncbi:MAG: hypothetical protein ACKVVP_05155 [Chloroflexota bacterium]